MLKSPAAITNRRFLLFEVAICLWVISLSNVVLGAQTIGIWLSSIIIILIVMYIGGVISLLFVQNPKEE
jgi:hypothetical protein